MRRLAGVLLLATSPALAGCGLLLHGNTQTVLVSTSPADATVSIPSAGAFTTPARVELLRSEPHALVIKKEGYADARVQLFPQRRAWVVYLDIFLTLGFGLIVDGVTGAWYALAPGEVTVSLDPLDAGPGSVQGAPVFVTIRNAPDGILVAATSPIRVDPLPAGR